MVRAASKKPSSQSCRQDAGGNPATLHSFALSPPPVPALPADEPGASVVLVAGRSFCRFMRTRRYLLPRPTSNAKSPARIHATAYQTPRVNDGVLLRSTEHSPEQSSDWNHPKRFPWASRGGLGNACSVVRFVLESLGSEVKLMLIRRYECASVCQVPLRSLWYPH